MKIIIERLMFVLFFFFLTGSYSKASAEPASDSINRNTGDTAIRKGYASVNGLKMYYEIHGKGQPIVLIHGAYSGINSSFGALIPELAKTRQVIALELQGHSRTADMDRALGIPQLSDDVVALMKQLSIKQADIFGFSLGSAVGFELALRHPEMVRKLIMASFSYRISGIYPEIWGAVGSITPEMFEGTPFKKEYDSLAPDPKHFPVLMEKLKALNTSIRDRTDAELKSIQAPTLLIAADGDIVKPEHIVEIFKMMGGGPGINFGQPSKVQMAIIPGSPHATLTSRNELLIPIINGFLDIASN